MNGILIGIGVLAATHIMLQWWQAISIGKAARSNTVSDLTQPNPEKWPSVAVLIPAWKERGTLETCVEALLINDYPSWEIIIIAGGPDGSFQHAQTLYQDNSRIRVIEQPPAGKNAALNLGLRQTSAEVIVVLDADSRVRPDYVRELVRPVAIGSDTATGAYWALHRTPVSETSHLEHIQGYEIFKGSTLQGSGGIALKREVLDTLGGFDESVLVGVDWDLNLRVEMHGFSRAYAANAVLVTQRPSTLIEYWRNEVRWRRAHLHLLNRHRTWFTQSMARFAGATLFYLVALVFSGLCVLTICSILFDVQTVSGFLAGLTTLFAVWMLARRASLAGMVAAYKSDYTLLRLTPVIMLLLLISIAASWRAVTTMHRISPHFKGPRSQQTESRSAL